MAHIEASYFGPPSQPIDIAKFTGDGVDLRATVAGENEWNAVPDARKAAIEGECSVLDIQNGWLTQWTTPSTHAHLTRSIESTVANIHGDADPTTNRKKRKRPTPPDTQIAAVKALQANLDSIHLKSWPLSAHSALFMRAGRTSDSNVLTAVKKSPYGATDLPQLSESSHEALITITVYHRLAWANGVPSRGSQHIFLSSQSLGDLFETIPCASNEIPEQVLENDRVIGYKDTSPESSPGSVFLIDGVAYGDGQSEEDYADKLMALLDAKPADKRPALVKSPHSMHDTVLSSIPLRINQPYWLLHQGNCEHFIVVEQIRTTPTIQAGIPSPYTLLQKQSTSAAPATKFQPFFQSLETSDSERVRV